jgi:hypothetical protein
MEISSSARLVAAGTITAVAAFAALSTAVAAGALNCAQTQCIADSHLQERLI